MENAFLGRRALRVPSRNSLREFALQKTANMDERDDYDPTEFDDSGERTVSELEDVHSTLKDIHSSLKKILSALESRNPWSGLVGAFIVIALIMGWPGSKLDRWTDRVWYSIMYSTDWKNVNIEKRPLDCDFFHAPVGDKGCHYKKSTIVFGEEQRRALMQQATAPQERENYTRQPNSVTVYWERKEE